VAEYGAGVTRVGDRDADVAAAVTAALGRHGAVSLALPAGLPPGWRPDGPAAVVDQPPLATEALAALDAVLTGCSLAIAETGTLVLSGGAPGEGRRAITLLPDVHVCVVEASRIVETVPEAIARLARSRRPLTFVSGPSATSDIGFVRVEGVHGPRRLEVVMIDGAAGSPASDPAR
jgi:L-lactate dehydrogenase complex protein LldG